MKLLKKMRYIFSILLVVSPLFSITPVAHGFILLTFGLQLDGLELLILKVHKPQWKIGYRYHVDCKPAERQNGKALTETISASLRTWLEPLKELQPERPIVDRFVYELQADFNPNQPEDLEGLQAVDLRVTFECTQGASGAPIGRIYPPAVIMRVGTEVTPWMHFVLTHELGHTFGLADTYARQGVMRSRGGLPWTAGKQPWSIMSGGHQYADIPLTLSEDDKRGIIWLYKYFYEGIATDDCFFPDYIFVEEPRGCRPEYQLIFATKYSHPDIALLLLKEDPTIDVNAQDVDGMTALHYAVMHEKEEVVKALLGHKDINPSLMNKQGQTPLDIALAANHTAIIKMFPEPPRRKEDVNGDGVVNIQDLVAVAAAFGEAAANAPSAADLSPETAQQWLSAANQLSLTDTRSQRGIRFLEQLLLALTPKETVLLPNYPNPFNPETWIPYQLSAPADVTIEIRAIDGTLVRTLSLGHRVIGTYQSRTRAAHWDGRNNIGEPVASGVYFYTLTTGDFTATRKMLIRK